MRSASCTKPITAAATQRLSAANFINYGDFAFETGQPGGGIVWPTQGVDGQWIDLDNILPGNGSFEVRWKSIPLALGASPDEATVNIKPSTSNGTGTINQRIRIRAPLGTVSIGQ